MNFLQTFKNSSKMVNQQVRSFITATFVMNQVLKYLNESSLKMDMKDRVIEQKEMRLKEMRMKEKDLEKKLKEKNAEIQELIEEMILKDDFDGLTIRTRANWFDTSSTLSLKSFTISVFSTFVPELT